MNMQSPEADWSRLRERSSAQSGRIAAAVVFALLAAVAIAGSSSLLGPLLASLLHGHPVRWGSWTISANALSWKVPTILVSLAIVKAGAGWANASLMATVGQRVIGDLRSELHEHLLRLPPHWHQRHHSGELLARFSSDLGIVEFASAHAYAAIIKDALQVIALMVLCFVTDRTLFLIAFVAVPATVIPVTTFARWAKRAARASQASLGALTSLSSEQVHNLPIVQAYRSESATLARFDAEQGRFLAAAKRSLLIRGAFTPSTELLGVGALAVCIVVGAGAVARNPSLAATLGTFFAAVLWMYQPVKGLAQTWSELARARPSIARLFEILDAPLAPNRAAPCPPLRSELAFASVGLRYGEHPALAGVTFAIPVGSTVALVGPSGGGKTSILALLLGLTEVSEGEILWDGTPLQAYDLASRRAQLAWVPQEPVLLSGTIRHNVCLGVAEASDDAIWTALKRAHAADFVAAVPGRLDAEVGERGLRLSGGQRQRIAIARALLIDAPILLLDEPTSALDLETESAVQDGLKAARGRATTIVVAHRLATVREADAIYVFESGTIVEAGSHEALAAAGGRYAAMLEAGSSKRSSGNANPNFGGNADILVR